MLAVNLHVLVEFGGILVLERNWRLGRQSWENNEKGR